MSRLDNIRDRRESSADVDWLLAEYDKLTRRLSILKVVCNKLLDESAERDESDKVKRKNDELTTPPLRVWCNERERARALAIYRIILANRRNHE